MASKAAVTLITLFLSFNLMFFYLAEGKCNTLNLGVCANVLGGLVNVQLGAPPKQPCCSLISGLVDLEAAACVCTALKAGVLGFNLTIPIDLSLLLIYCGKDVPAGFQCP